MTQGEIVVLGILSYKDRYGYEIDKHIERNDMRVWTDLGFSSIYNILNKLNKKELIDYRFEDETDGPKRKVYSILEAGQKVLNESLIEMLKTPVLPKQDIDVGIVFSSYLDKDVIKKALTTHQDELKKDVIVYKGLLENKYSNKQSVGLLFKRVLMHMETDIVWIDDIIQNY